MYELTFRISDGYAFRKDSEYSLVEARVDIYQPLPVIGQQYLVVFYCDYDNSEYGQNYTVEITEENIAEITFNMNDTENDITEYILIQ